MSGHERCYDCGDLIPEGELRREWVTKGRWAGGDMESFCEPCARKHRREKAEDEMESFVGWVLVFAACGCFVLRWWQLGVAFTVCSALAFCLVPTLMRLFYHD